MRVLVCGGRYFADFTQLVRVLDELHAEHQFSLLIHGNAPGADQLSYAWARLRKVSSHSYPADWARLGRSAGMQRNQQMLDVGRPSLVVAFPGGAGTRDMVTRTRAAKVRVIEVSKDGTLTGK